MYIRLRLTALDRKSCTCDTSAHAIVFVVIVESSSQTSPPPGQARPDTLGQSSQGSQSPSFSFPVPCRQNTYCVVVVLCSTTNIVLVTSTLYLRMVAPDFCGHPINIVLVYGGTVSVGSGCGEREFCIVWPQLAATSLTSPFHHNLLYPSVQSLSCICEAVASHGGT